MLEQFGLSKKQEAYALYLLQRLGFSIEEDLINYLKYLQTISINYKKLGRLHYEELNEDDVRRQYFTLQDDYWVPNNFRLVDLLNLEYTYKRKLLFKKLVNNSTYISATDLANYTYCPIGYSISKSFAIPTIASAEMGIELHEKHRLISKAKPNFESYEEIKKANYVDESNEFFFDEIKSSELIFCGHETNENRYFKNESNKFIGQPDYIFKNQTGQLFVVEEKFKRINNFNYSNKQIFSNNHKIQVASYIYYLERYQIEYGYLVYWIYDYSDNEPYIKNCFVLKIHRDDNTERILETTFVELKTFIQTQKKSIDLSTIRPYKCVNCVHMIICSHKNKKRDVVTLPYDQNYFQLFSAPYPDILSDKK